MLVKHTEYRTV